MSPSHCSCASLPERFEDSNLTNVTVVAGFAGDEVLGKTCAFYQCVDCGQWWRDGSGDDRALRKVESPA
jgi:hypothetical protein